MGTTTGFSQFHLQSCWSSNNTFIKGSGSGDQVGEVKKKDVYDVELTTVNAADKIKIIKVIRETLNLGLKEAK